MYRKTPKNSDTQNILIILNFDQHGFSIEDADGIANSVDPDQTAPLGTLLFGK